MSRIAIAAALAAPLILLHAVDAAAAPAGAVTSYVKPYALKCSLSVHDGEGLKPNRTFVTNTTGRAIPMHTTITIGYYDNARGRLGAFSRTTYFIVRPGETISFFSEDRARLCSATVRLPRIDTDLIVKRR